MISTISDLKRIHKQERMLYLQGSNWIHRLRLRFTHEYIFDIYRFVYWLRICEYFCSKNTIGFRFGLALSRRKKNALGRLLGIAIHENCFEEGLMIFHGNIIVNKDVRVGKNCKLHGMNCIGNNGKNKDVPNLGSDVELGIGAVIIGGVLIHSGCTIGANAVVNKSSSQENMLLTGIPAKEKCK